MSHILQIGRSEIFDRDLFSLSLPNFRALPETISMPSRHFFAFLAADVTNIDSDEIAEFSRNLIKAGCAYFCVWGAGCERVHDIFDEQCFEVEPLIMTTWHTSDSLDEALWFLVNCTYPDDGYHETSKSALAISIGRPDWDEHIRKRLADLDSLTRDVVHKT